MPNKSLDASGISAFLSDNLSVTRLSPAASTLTLIGAQRGGGQRAAAAHQAGVAFDTLKRVELGAARRLTIVSCAQLV